MKKFSPLLIITAACLWATLGLFVRGLKGYGLNPMEIVALRAFGAFITLAAYGLIFNRKLFKIKLKDIWCFLGTGIASMVFFNYFYFTTITMTSLSVAATLLYSAPSIVLILSAILFHEKFTMRKIIALIMSFVGIVFVSGVIGASSEINFMGLLAGLAAGLGYALYSIFGRYALDKGYSSLTISVYTFLLASLGVAPFTDFSHLAGSMSKDFKTWILTTAIVLFPTVLAYVFYTFGLSNLESGRASIIASIEPVVATLLGIIIYKEQTPVIGITGVILVLCSTVLVNLKRGLVNKLKNHKSGRRKCF